jgi:hypothetical protein
MTMQACFAKRETSEFWITYVLSSVLWSSLRCSVRLHLHLFVGGLMSYLGCSVHLHLQLFVGKLMSYLRYLCLFAFSDVQHMLCCVFIWFFFVLCTLILPVSLDCPFLIAPSVLSNIYFLWKFWILGQRKKNKNCWFPLTLWGQFYPGWSINFIGIFSRKKYLWSQPCLFFQHELEFYFLFSFFPWIQE